MAKKPAQNNHEPRLVTRLLIMAIASFSFFLFWPYEPHPSWSAELTAVVLSCLLYLVVIATSKRDEKLSVSAYGMALVAMLVFIQLVDLANGFPVKMTSMASTGFLTTAVLLALSIQALKKQGYEILPTLAWGLIFGACIQYLFSFLQVGGFLLDYQEFTKSLSLWVPHFNPRPEANGLVFQKNQLADYTVIAMTAVAYLVCKKRLATKYFWIHLPIGALILALTASRTVFIYMAAVLALSFCPFEKMEFTKRFKLYLRAIAITGTLFLFSSPIIMDLISELSPKAFTNTAISRIGESKGGDNMRFMLWKSAWGQFLKTPIMGNGSGSYSYTKAKYLANHTYNPNHTNSQFYFHSHNMPLQIMSEYGISVTLAVLIGLFICLWQLVRRPLDIERSFILVSTGIILIHSQLEHPLWFMYFIALFTIFMAAADFKTLELPFAKTTKLMGAIIAVSIIVTSINYTSDYVFLPWVKYRKDKQPLSVEQKQQLIYLTQHPLLGTSASVLALGEALDLSSQNLEFKLHLTERLAKERPTPFTMYRRALFLTYAGRHTEAREVLKQTFYSYDTAQKYMFGAYSRMAKDSRLDPMRDSMIAIHNEMQKQKQIREKNN